MGLVWTEDFESGLGAWTVTGSAATGTTFHKSGTHGLDLTCTGSAKYITRALPASCRLSVWGFWCYFDTDANASASIIQADMASGGFNTMQFRVGNKLRTAQTGGNSADSGAFADDAWHWISVKIDSSASPWTMAYYVDGVSQTGGSQANAASDQTFVKFGNTATNTYIRWADDLSLYDSSGDFPVAQPSSSTKHNVMGTAGFFGLEPSEGSSLWLPGNQKAPAGLYL